MIDPGQAVEVLKDAGVSLFTGVPTIVIYANHLLRSAYPAMVETANSILSHGRALEADQDLLPIGAALELIPGNR